eukprot:scaffold75021_cov66-Attheya_sp.AAC.1
MAGAVESITTFLELLSKLHVTSKFTTLGGVYFTKYFPAEDGSVVWEAQQRAAMGLRSSPTKLCRDPKNVFRWDRVMLNLPRRSDNYDPARPWVLKVRDSDGSITADVHGFMDNFRTSGKDKKGACWQEAAHRVASMVYIHLGLQDAARKCRDGSQTRSGGAWIGSVLRTGGQLVFFWNSLRRKVEKTNARIAEQNGFIKFRQMVCLPRM